MKNIILSFLIVNVIFSCKTTSEITPKTSSTYCFNFVESEDLNSVLELAKSKYQLVYLDISASWCAPCQLMKRDVYTHRETSEFFNKNFVNYLVDAEKGEGPDLKVIYGVTNYPTLLILDGRGRVVSRREGGTYHEALLEFGKEALLKNPTM